MSELPRDEFKTKPEEKGEEVSWRALSRHFSLILLYNRAFWTLAVLSVLAANAVWSWRNRLNADVAWYLYALTRMRDGAVLYRDLHDINLPIVYLVYMPVAWLSNLSGVPVRLTLYLVAWSVVGAMLWTFRRIPVISVTGRGLVFFSVAFATLSVNRLHLAQRDTVCALLFAGMVISSFQRIENPNRRSSASSWIMILLAAIGVAMKPYFLVPWVLVTGELIYSDGLRRTLLMKEAWMPPLISAASWIVTLTAFPDYLSMVATASRYYSSLNDAWYMFLPLILPAFVVFRALRFKRKSPRRPLIRLSALATAGFALECLLQRKAFPYHFTPSMLWSLVTAGLMIADRWESVTEHLPSWKMSTGTLAGSLALVGYSFWCSLVSPVFGRDKVDEFVIKHAQFKTILSLCTNPWITFPVVLEAHATNVRSDGSMWTLAGMYRDQVERAGESPTLAKYHTRSEMGKEERLAFDEVVFAISVNKPTLILVEMGREKWGMGNLQFDFIDYFSTDSAFKEAFRSYKLGTSQGSRKVWELDENADNPAQKSIPGKRELISGR